MGPQGTRRRPSTVLSAGAVGFGLSRLAVEEGAIAPQKADRADGPGLNIADHRGRMVDTAGERAVA